MNAVARSIISDFLNNVVIESNNRIARSIPDEYKLLPLKTLYEYGMVDIDQIGFMIASKLFFGSQKFIEISDNDTYSVDKILSTVGGIHFIAEGRNDKLSQSAEKYFNHFKKTIITVIKNLKMV